jgi:segregation and condensation protein B
MLKQLIEGILFLTAEDWSVENLATTVKQEPTKVEQVLNELVAEYNNSSSVLAVRKVGNYYSMNIKPNYIGTFKKYVHAKEFTRSEAKLLAVINAKPGVLKSELAKKLGSQVYEHLAALVERKFINEVKEGRSTRLFVTDKYKEYAQMYAKKDHVSQAKLDLVQPQGQNEGS